MSVVNKMREKIFSFGNGKELKYIEQEETVTKRNPEGKEVTEVKSSFRILDIKSRECTPWIAGTKNDKETSFNIHNDSYIVFFKRNSNTLYRVKPKENDSDELYEMFEFKGKKIKDIELQLNTDTFVITLFDECEEVKVLFDMASFRVISEYFKSLSYADESLKPDQRKFVKEDAAGNLIEGIITLKGEIEESTVIPGKDIDSVIISGKGGEALFDIDSCRIVSTIFRSVYGRVNDLGVHYENEPRFFTKKVSVNGKDVILKGIVNSYGQIAPFALNTVSKELIALPLYKDSGIDHIDDVALRKDVSSNERSTAPNEEELLVKINNAFLTAKFCKVGIEGYTAGLFQYDKIISDTEPVRLNYDMRVSNDVVTGIRLNTYVSASEICFYRDIFRKAQKASMNLTKNQPSDPLYSFDTSINTGCGGTIETSGKVDSRGILRGGCILNAYSDEYSNNNGLTTASFREISSLHAATVEETINCELFGLQVSGIEMPQHKKEKK